MINSIGLANIGIDNFVAEKIPLLKKLGAIIIANVAAKRIEDYVTLCENLSSCDDVNGIELNLSCPNVKEGGIEFGTDLNTLATIVARTRKVFHRTLVVKLTPNVTKISDFAKAAEDHGADAVTVANTYVGMAIDIYTRKPKIHTVTGGYSGPAIKPLTLAKVFQVFKSVKIPIIASGGIFNWQDIIEYTMAGATAVQIGTVLFTKPDVPIELIEGIDGYLFQSGVSKFTELIGCVDVNF